jgi:type II secretion system protein C
MSTRLRRAVAFTRLALIGGTALAGGALVSQSFALTGPPPQPPAPARTAPAAAPSAARDLEPTIGADLFGVAVPAADAPMATQTECDGAPRSVLPLRLVGTVVSPLPDVSAAVVADTRVVGDGATYAIGDAIGTDARLEQIDADRVCVLNLGTGKRESLRFGDVVAAAPPARAPKGAIKSGIEKIGADSYRVSLSAVEAAMADSAALARSARFVPTMKDGKLSGYRVAMVKPESPLHGVLEKGDVIERVNGVSLADTNAALGLLGQMKQEGRFVVEGRRGSTPLKLDVELRR